MASRSQYRPPPPLLHQTLPQAHHSSMSAHTYADSPKTDRYLLGEQRISLSDSLQCRQMNITAQHHRPPSLHLQYPPSHRAHKQIGRVGQTGNKQRGPHPRRSRSPADTSRTANEPPKHRFSLKIRAGGARKKDRTGKSEKGDRNLRDPHLSAGAACWPALTQ